METKKLIERLAFEGHDVFLDAEKVLTEPLTELPLHSGNAIAVIGYGDRKLFVGSAGCCQGLFSTYAQQGTEEAPTFRLERVAMPDLNVYDILPVLTDTKKTGFGNPDAVLVTGGGCAGAGIRLLDQYYPKSHDILSTEEFGNLAERVSGTGHAKSRLRVDQTGKVLLDFSRGYWRTKAGMPSTRFGNILVGSNEELVFAEQPIYTEDLTPRLEKFGLNIKGTKTINERYDRIWK
ncbi:MAG: hypothetical protein Q7R96_06300 [Nanoarchaeota archaeon]|nr:hypothetical protein [Nanoarchaeota archaeon]